MFLIKGVFALAEKIHEEVEKELYDEGVIKRQLLDLQARREAKLVSDEEFKEAQADLFARLRVVQERRMAAMQDIHSADSSAFVIEQTDGGESRDR